MGKPVYGKLEKHERERLAELGKKTIKPQERTLREPKPEGGFTPRGH